MEEMDLRRRVENVAFKYGAGVGDNPSPSFWQFNIPNNIALSQ